MVVVAGKLGDLLAANRVLLGSVVPSSLACAVRLVADDDHAGDLSRTAAPVPVRFPSPPTRWPLRWSHCGTVAATRGVLGAVPGVNIGHRSVSPTDI